MSSLPRPRAFLTYSFSKSEVAGGRFISFIAYLEVVNLGMILFSMRKIEYLDRVTGRKGEISPDDLFQTGEKVLLLRSGESAFSSFLSLAVMMPNIDDVCFGTRARAVLFAPCWIWVVGLTGRRYRVHMSRAAKRDYRRCAAERMRKLGCQKK